MATLRELSRHLHSVKTVGQISGAMRSVATANYARLQNRYAVFEEYSLHLQQLLAFCGGTNEAQEVQEPAAISGKVLYVVFRAPRGLCGSYTSELNAFLDNTLAQEQREYELREIVFEDVPSSERADEIAGELTKEYEEGVYSEIILVHQHFINVMKREATAKRFLPVFGHTSGNADCGALLLPSKDVVLNRLLSLEQNAALLEALLDAAVSYSSATMMAMHEACDNAAESAEKIGLAISRKRQADITAGVIETASGTETED